MKRTSNERSCPSRISAPCFSITIMRFVSSLLHDKDFLAPSDDVHSYRLGAVVLCRCLLFEMEHQSFGMRGDIFAFLLPVRDLIVAFCKVVL